MEQLQEQLRDLKVQLETKVRGVGGDVLTSWHNLVSTLLQHG